MHRIRSQTCNLTTGTNNNSGTSICLKRDSLHRYCKDPIQCNYLVCSNRLDSTGDVFILSTNCTVIPCWVAQMLATSTNLIQVKFMINATFLSTFRAICDHKRPKFWGGSAPFNPPSWRPARRQTSRLERGLSAPFESPISNCAFQYYEIGYAAKKSTPFLDVLRFWHKTFAAPCGSHVILRWDRHNINKVLEFCNDVRYLRLLQWHLYNREAIQTRSL